MAASATCSRCGRTFQTSDVKKPGYSLDSVFSIALDGVCSDCWMTIHQRGRGLVGFDGVPMEITAKSWPGVRAAFQQIDAAKQRARDAETTLGLRQERLAIIGVEHLKHAAGYCMEHGEENPTLDQALRELYGRGYNVPRSTAYDWMKKAGYSGWRSLCADVRRALLGA
jgi:hypothetical protein